MTTESPGAGLESLSPDQLDLLLNPEKDKEWVESYLQVPSEDRGVVAWKATVQQDRILQVTRRIRRNLIVKGRQTRCSTILMAKWIRKATQVYGQNFVILTQTDEMSQNFRQFIKDRFGDLNALGFDYQFEIDNQDKLRIKNNRNTFHFASAEQKVGLRGIQTAHNVHASEVAHWPDGQARKIIGGLLPAVPPNGIFVAESTPNGAAGWFYEKVKDSMPLVPESLWTTSFFPWWLEKSYTFSHPEVVSALIDSGLDPETMRLAFQPTVQEETLMTREGLDLDQMLWRRMKTRDLLSTGQFFAQEYPEDLLSCWLASGIGFFHDDQFDHLAYYRERVRPPMTRMRQLTYQDPVTGVRSEIDFLGANFAIYEPPQPGHRYVAFQDTSAGVAVDGDYSAFAILDADRKKHVATLRVRTLPTRVGAMACAAGAYYNWAFVGVERNTYGLSALEEMNRLHYPNLYYDFINQPNKPELGWFTSETSRELMLNRFRNEVFSHNFDTSDEMAVLEMGGFAWKQVQGRTGNIRFRAEADRGNDDLVIALAGAVTIAPYAPNRVKSGGNLLFVGTPKDDLAQIAVDENGIVQHNGRQKLSSAPWLGV